MKNGFPFAWHQPPLHWPSRASLLLAAEGAVAASLVPAAPNCPRARPSSHGPRR